MLGGDSLVARDNSAKATTQPATGAHTASGDGSVPPFIKVNATVFLDGDAKQPVLVKYVGWTRFNTKGIWVGVAYGKPLGKHGGCVDGHRYFNCKPKHGLFVRPGRLHEAPSDPSTLPAPEPQAKLPKKVLPRVSKVTARTKSASSRSLPGQSSKKPTATKSRQVRWYVDPQGKRFTTLKEFDPYGRPTRLVGEGGDPDDPASGAMLKDLETKIRAEEEATREAARRAEQRAQEAAEMSRATAEVATENSIRLAQAVTDLQRAEFTRQQRESQEALNQGSNSEDIIREVERRHSAEVAALEEIRQAEIAAAAQAAREAVASEMAAQRAAEEKARADREEAEAAAQAKSEAMAKAEREAAEAAQKAVREADEARRRKMAEDPLATGLSEDEDDGKGSVDPDVDAWFWSKVRPKPVEEAAAAAAVAPTESPSRHRQSQLAPSTLPAVSTEEGCAALAKGLKAAAINEDWGLVRDLLVERCMALVITEDMIKRSGIGKVVGKLRKAANPGVVFAAEEVIDGWKTQIAFDKPGTASKEKVGTSKKIRSERALSRMTDTSSVDPENHDASADDGTFLVRVSRRAGLLGDDTVPMLDDTVIDALHPEADSDNSEDEEIEDEFVAVSTLVQCEALVDRVKILTAEKKWRRLHRLLREQVAGLLVTEDDLRRSGIGRVMAKVVRHTEKPEVRLLATDIINQWKDKVHHRDPHEERELETERIEREKFQDFINLAPASLGIQSGECEEGVDITGVSSEQVEPSGPVYYEKEFELARGLRRKPLGFQITIGNPPSGGTSAIVGRVASNGLAAKAAREGCAIEEGDEVLSVNGKELKNCTREETMALFKSANVKLVLRSIMPGSELAEEDGEEAGLYSTAGMPLFDKVRPSDFVTLA